MRHALLATAFALACAAAAAAAQSGRVRRPEPAAQPTPEQPAEQRDAGEQGGGRAVTGKAEDDRPETWRDSEGNPAYSVRHVTRRAQILSRPAPDYPRRARARETQGTISLRLLLASSGKVEHIAVIKGLPDGLTEEAIKAARKIKFVPAEKDGRKVSQWATIQYNFSIY